MGLILLGGGSYVCVQAGGSAGALDISASRSGLALRLGFFEGCVAERP